MALASVLALSGCGEVAATEVVGAQAHPASASDDGGAESASPTGLDPTELNDLGPGATDDLFADLDRSLAANEPQPVADNEGRFRGYYSPAQREARDQRIFDRLAAARRQAPGTRNAFRGYRWRLPR